jgi:hypothetical protein
MLGKSIPGEERLFQEPLSHCAGLGANMLVSEQTLWWFRGMYHQVGFTPLNTFLHHTNGGEYAFLRMLRPT